MLAYGQTDALCRYSAPLAVPEYSLHTEVRPLCRTRGTRPPRLCRSWGSSAFGPPTFATSCRCTGQVGAYRTSPDLVGGFNGRAKGKEYTEENGRKGVEQ